MNRLHNRNYFAGPKRIKKLFYKIRLSQNQSKSKFANKA